MPAPSPSAELTTFGLMQVGESMIGVNIENLTEVYPLGELAPLMVSHPAFLGAMRLRGRLIPVFDPRVMCGLPAAEEPRGIAAILTHAERLVGLAVNEITGLAKTDATALQRLETGEADSGGLFFGGFYYKDRVVNVIDPVALFAIPGLPSAERFRRQEDTHHAAGRKAYLTFRAGGATFAAPAVDVHGTLPRQPVDRDALAGGPCLGSVRVNGVRIPVLDAPAVLGLGATRERENPEIVVIGFEGEQLLGLAVDVICRIAGFAQDSLRPAPALLGGGQAALGALVTEEDGQQTYIVRVDHLRQDKDLQSMAALSGKVDESDGRKAPAHNRADNAIAPISDETGENADAIFRERRRYVVFRAGGRFAVPIENIIRILEPPKGVTPFRNAGQGVVGLFSVDGQPVTLVCLSQYLFIGGRSGSERQRVLLAGNPGRQIGILVDSVDGIETSTWRAANTDPSPFLEQMVKLGRGGARVVLPCLDVDALSERIAGGNHAVSDFA